MLVLVSGLQEENTDLLFSSQQKLNLCLMKWKTVKTAAEHGWLVWYTFLCTCSLRLKWSHTCFEAWGLPEIRSDRLCYLQSDWLVECLTCALVAMGYLRWDNLLLCAISQEVYMDNFERTKNCSFFVEVWRSRRDRGYSLCYRACQP